MSSLANLFFRLRPSDGPLAAPQVRTEPVFVHASRPSKFLILVACVVVVTFLMLLPPLAQTPSYHNFADRRTILDIPDFWDVISNLPFLVVGLMGLLRFRDQALRLLFFGVFCTSLGSAYYWSARLELCQWD